MAVQAIVLDCMIAARFRAQLPRVSAQYAVGRDLGAIRHGRRHEKRMPARTPPYNPPAMPAFRRSMFAWIALLGIVFTQLAVAGHACARLAVPTAPASEQGRGDMVGMPCEATQAGIELDANQPGLCAQHCVQGSQSFDSSPPPALHPALVLAFILPVFELDEPTRVSHAQPGLAQLTEPPPFLRTARLRI